ncbi:MAG: 16S rRNA (adenine(1518)-N(6)/adenine(1519)-N(6))-dimethyltransferase RsmA [Candidatus Saccharimonadales bacterium]
MPTNKSLGQHWLKDRLVLESIAESAELVQDDTILEIGPGLGTLTSVLLGKAKKVVAVEFDAALATKLPGQFPGKNLEVRNEDILQFDLSPLPAGYKVVANVPYYITSKIVQKLMTADNKPATSVLLLQREVAQRLAATPGNMSILALSAQVYAEVSLGDLVSAEYFTPSPKVDSQVVILKTRDQPFVRLDEEKAFFRLVKIAFAAKRKMLRSSLSAGLRLKKDEIDAKLVLLGIDPNLRAEDLTIAQWLELTKTF